MPLELEIDVPESRQVTLPDSVPVGRVKLTVQTPLGPLAPLPDTSDKFERERAAFFRLLPELLKTHRGKVVAIHNEQVIAVGDERRPVIDEATRIAGDVDLYVETVAEEWPVERVGTRRVVGRRVS
ncbi:MAG: DUF5678 domain-containing protein [Fimbriiglobus sp.]|jgi:hypothetical protein|nr:DUF5678 domain-containing protein [Fimbriiglobus sp.]